MRGKTEGPEVWYEREVEGGLEIWTGDTKSNRNEGRTRKVSYLDCKETKRDD